MLKRVMHKLERRLAARTPNRVFRPFEWGVEFLNPAFMPQANGHALTPREMLLAFNERACRQSDQFFGLPDALPFTFDGFWLSFPSAVTSPYRENNLVTARYFPVAGRADEEPDSRAAEVQRAAGRAVIVLPQWNGDSESHIGLCKLFSRIGIAALRLSLPYHDRRMPAELARADYLVSANVGRTLQAVQQAVVDTRAAIHWLHAQGYDRIGIAGTSIGSCVSFLTFVHDERVCAGAFNMVSSYFGDVVWAGMATEHVRRGLETELTEAEVRQMWMAISPNAYIGRLAQNPRPGLFISARYDLTFTPQLSQLLFDECERHRLHFDKRILPCGHYSIGEAPFRYYDGYLIVNYLRKHL